MSRKNREVFPMILDKMDRRQFLKCSALLGGSLALPPAVWHLFGGSEAVFADVGDSYIQYRPENQIYSVCQQCNTNCGIKVKIVDGMVAKIDGNPYNPWTMTPHISYSTPIAEAAVIEGALCPKGQAGIQTLYDPYRIVKVLKRAGKRGENKWKTIPFDQAILEIVDGGDLFGEGRVEGLKDICTLKDTKISAALAEDAAQVASKKMTLEDFKKKHAANLQYLIDPDHPDLGPKNNQLCLAWGRLKAGRAELLRRFVQTGLGSFNAHGHTTVCQGSALLWLQGHERPVRGGQVDGRKQVLLAGRHGECRVHPLRGGQPIRGQLRPPLAGREDDDGHGGAAAEDRRGGPEVLQDGLACLEVAPREAQRCRRPGDGDDALDPRERPLRCTLSCKCQQGRRRRGQRTHLDPGGLSRQAASRRKARHVSARLRRRAQDRETEKEGRRGVDLRPLPGIKGRQDCCLRPQRREESRVLEISLSTRR